MEKLEKLLASAEVVVLEFYSPRCHHCARMESAMRDISRLTSPATRIYAIDVSENTQLSDELGIEVTPEFVIFKNSEEVWRWPGEIDGWKLLAKINSYES